MSTASGRDEAMAVVHAVAESEDHDLAAAVEAEGGEPLAPHEATKIIGEVLAELD